MEKEKATEFHLHALDCLRFAERIADPKQKLILLLIAKAWLLLARFIEKSHLADAEASWPDDLPRGD